MTDAIRVLGGAAADQRERQDQLVGLLRETPVPERELLHNLGLYMTRQTLSRMLLMHDLYRQQLDVHGIICEFGVRWGQNLALWTAFRGMYEPYNYNRRIVGFDTWEGFPSVDPKDGVKVSVGDYGVTPGYERHLEQLLSLHEAESPVAHKRKHELVRGDATVTFDAYLAEHPETIVSLAYFDFDPYAPTKRCLDLLMPRLTKGSIVAFDELNCPEFPGETQAVMETVGLARYAIRRTPLNPLVSYLVID